VPDATSATQSFYGRWAPVYDLIATRTPGVGRLRERTVGALDLDGGETVVDLGCGTGATLPYIREAVGPDGRVVGVDLTPELLFRARARTRLWENVAVVRGDATRPPLGGPVDAVVASFVVGMLSDPAAAVDRWLDLVSRGGRVAILDAASSPHPMAVPFAPLFNLFVRLGAPQGSSDRTDEPPIAVLDRRVDAAHGALVERTDADVDRSVLGFVRLTVGEL